MTSRLFCLLFSAAACAASPFAARYVERYCAQTFSRKKRIVSAVAIALCAVVSCVLAALRFPFGAYLCAVSVTSFSAAALSLCDLCCQEIPPLFSAGILLCSAAICIEDRAHIVYHLLGAAVVGGVLLLLYLLSRGRAMGFGDVKLMFAASLGLGLSKGIAAFLIAFVLAAVVHPVCMLLFRRDNRLAFGPYLAVGIVGAYVFGDALVQWYITLIR